MQIGIPHSSREGAVLNASKVWREGLCVLHFFSPAVGAGTLAEKEQASN
jgi:hypothetical protein